MSVAAPTRRPGLRAARVLEPLGHRLIATGVDFLLVPAIVVTVLNSGGALSFMATPTIKIAATALGFLAALVVLARGIARPRFPIFVALVVLLGFMFVITSVLRDIPSGRFLLMGQYLAIVAAMLIWLCVRADRVIGILYTASLIHLVLARVFNTETEWSDGLTRLGGGSHPITLGFEASIVVVVSIVAAIGAISVRRRIVLLVIACYAVYILVEAFSRQSLIAESVAIVVLAIVVPGPWRWVRAFAAVVIAVAIVSLLGPDGIASLLGADQLSDLSTATGRTDIWARLLPYFPEFAALGFGYSSLNDAIGPDLDVYYATHGEPAENAILQILLDVGVIGAIIWAAVLLTGFAVMLRARGPSFVLATATLPLFISSVLVSSSLGDGGMQWWWFLAVVAEAGASAAPRVRRRRRRRTVTTGASPGNAPAEAAGIGVS